MKNDERAKKIAKGLAASDEYPYDYLSAYAGAMQMAKAKDEQQNEGEQIPLTAEFFERNGFSKLCADVFKGCNRKCQNSTICKRLEIS